MEKCLGVPSPRGRGPGEEPGGAEASVVTTGSAGPLGGALHQVLRWIVTPEDLVAEPWKG